MAHNPEELFGAVVGIGILGILAVLFMGGDPDPLIAAMPAIAVVGLIGALFVLGVGGASR